MPDWGCVVACVTEGQMGRSKIRGHRSVGRSDSHFACVGVGYVDIEVDIPF